jgi:K+-transporting ATPase A subunit
VEIAVYRLGGINEAEEQPWTRYLIRVLALSLVSTLFSYLALRIQGPCLSTPKVSVQSLRISV